VKVKRGTLQTEFVMTDFEDEIQVAYRGVSKFEFKEGEDLVLTGYCPNIEDKSFVVGIDYLTKHSL
jgi:cytochrome c-type biogenesis protein CcmE